VVTSDVGLLAAFGGGVASFASPCILPLVPAYLSVVTGLDLGEMAGGSEAHLGRIARETVLFIAGFTVVFVLAGISATAIGGVVFRNHLLLTRVSGVVVLGLGLFLLGSLVLRLPGLYREAHVHIQPSRFGPFAAPVAGAAFGFGWTPCITPILASVLVVAASERAGLSSVALLVAYSLGLGVPFLVVGMAFGRLAGALGFLRRHSRGITAVAGSVLVILGVLLVADRLSWLTAEAQILL
jgi:cytochrome c-type biogenesis protein